MKNQRREQGQVLILIILAIVGIFGFAALAVDMSRTYSERRRAQNAADAAAYAAAFEKTQSGNLTLAKEKGLASAALNGFEDDSYEAEPGEEMDVEIHIPPIDGKYSVATETIVPSEYVQVKIRSTVGKTFSQFVFGGDLAYTVESIVRSRGQRSFANGAAIVATCANCCNALKLHGTADVHVRDGDIISNSTADISKAKGESCMDDDKPGKGDSGIRDGDPCINVENGGMYFGGTWDEGSDTGKCKDADNKKVPAIQTDELETKSSNLWPTGDPGMPGCEAIGLTENGDADGKFSGGTVGSPLELSPGIYPKGITITGATSSIRLLPGMYCLNGDLSISSGSLTGEGVMIVMRNGVKGGKTEPSWVTINTNGSVSLSAPADAQAIQDDTIYPGFKWSGFLIYMPYNNTGSITLGGGNTSNYTGTVYAPGPSEDKYKCSLNGNSGIISFNASVICYNVQVGGTGEIDIHYRDEVNAQSPPMVEQTK